MSTISINTETQKAESHGLVGCFCFDSWSEHTSCVASVKVSQCLTPATVGTIHMQKLPSPERQPCPVVMVMKDATLSMQSCWEIKLHK